MPHDLHGDPLGTHRVLEPLGALPQPAWRLDNDLDRHYATEIIVAVETLNIDAASFRQMEEAAGGEGPDGVVRQVMETVATRGKQHNPVTGSGGVDGWWRVLACAAWAHLDYTGTPVDLGDVHPPR